MPFLGPQDPVPKSQTEGLSDENRIDIQIALYLPIPPHSTTVGLTTVCVKSWTEFPTEEVPRGPGGTEGEEGLRPTELRRRLQSPNPNVGPRDVDDESVHRCLCTNRRGPPFWKFLSPFPIRIDRTPERDP